MSASEEPGPFVFVYGTLRTGFSNRGRDLLTLHGELVGEAAVAGQLYDLGSFPAMVEPEDPDNRVTGEVYRLTDEVETALERLDRYEGARGPSPLPYERRLVTAHLSDGTELEAWTYIWTDSVDSFERVDGGDYVGYLQQRS